MNPYAAPQTEPIDSGHRHEEITDLVAGVVIIVFAWPLVRCAGLSGDDWFDHPLRTLCWVVVGIAASVAWVICLLIVFNKVFDRVLSSL
jgi:ABC-type dipeptide/oligopeptide/nickel transport system permease component